MEQFLHSKEQKRYMKNKNSQLFDILAECTKACYNCFIKCLEEKDTPIMAACIKINVDCAQICQTTAAFISRGSEDSKSLMKICVEICKKCNEICSKHNPDHCQQCADACYKCAIACSAF